MTVLDVVRYAEIEPMMWKNGLGSTTQLAIFPPASGYADFEWRISVAKFESSAPFSQFDGVDRCLCVLHGALRLHDVVMTPDSKPLYFHGSDTVSAEVIDSPVLDLNLMYKPEKWRLSAHRHTWPAPTAVSITPARLLFSLSHRLVVTLQNQTQPVSVQLGMFDLLRASEDVTISISGEAPSSAYVIDVEPCGRIAKT